jgi:hypothetical protein
MYGFREFGSHAPDRARLKLPLQGQPERHPRASRRGQPTPVPCLPAPAIGRIREDQIERSHRAGGTELGGIAAEQPGAALQTEGLDVSSGSSHAALDAAFDKQRVRHPRDRASIARALQCRRNRSSTRAIQRLGIGMAQNVEQAFAAPVGGRPDDEDFGAARLADRGIHRRRSAPGPRPFPEAGLPLRLSDAGRPPAGLPPSLGGPSKDLPRPGFPAGFTPSLPPDLPPGFLASAPDLASSASRGGRGFARPLGKLPRRVSARSSALAGLRAGRSAAGAASSLRFSLTGRAPGAIQTLLARLR